MAVAEGIEVHMHRRSLASCHGSDGTETATITNRVVPYIAGRRHPAWSGWPLQLWTIQATLTVLPGPGGVLSVMVTLPAGALGTADATQILG